MKVLIVILLLISSKAFAHGDEDHSATTAPATTPSGGGAGLAMGSQLKVISYPGNLEVLAKYPVPALDQPITGRIFFAEYASNHPVNPTVINLSFPGALGAKVTRQPTRISDGVYEFTAVFVSDTSHTALLRYTYGDAEQLATLAPFYAGASAQRQLATSGTTVTASDEDTSPRWLFIPLAIGLLVLGYVLFRRRRQRLLLVAKGKGNTTISEIKTTST